MVSQMTCRLSSFIFILFFYFLFFSDWAISNFKRFVFNYFFCLISSIIAALNSICVFFSFAWFLFIFTSLLKFSLISWIIFLIFWTGYLSSLIFSELLKYHDFVFFFKAFHNFFFIFNFCCWIITVFYWRCHIFLLFHVSYVLTLISVHLV